jgi:hypothetical protein
MAFIKLQFRRGLIATRQTILEKAAGGTVTRFGSVRATLKKSGVGLKTPPKLFSVYAGKCGTGSLPLAITS